MGDDHAALGAQVFKDATAKFAEDSAHLQKLFHDSMMLRKDTL